MKIEGSRILITGGARGIGRALVDGLLEDGALVGVFEKDSAACQLLAEDYSAKVPTWECDVSDPLKVDRAVDSAWNSGFKPDVLINNAGIIHSEPLVNIAKKDDRVHSREAWRHVIAVDLDSVFYVTSRVVDGMVQRRCKGVVISISSISASGNPGQSAYSAAKAGVNALTKTWAKELGAFGIRFAAIAPGFLDTPSTRAALSENSVSRLQQQIPLRKLGTPEAIHLAVRAVIENDYVNGTILEVDGGLSI
jgi:3-oxoacyl-[acyl-carrier protein] reductase